MKIILPLLSVFFLACNNEPVIVQDPASEDLISITQAFNIDDQGDAITTFIINNSLNSEIIYSNDSYSVNSFSNGLMVSEEIYDNNNELLANTSYVYDASGRLTTLFNYTLDNGLEFLSYQLEAEYAGNQILVSKTGYDLMGEITYQDVDIFTLDNENRIMKSQDSNSANIWEATYENGNLATFQISGYGDNYDGTATFTYSDELASEPYQKEKYRFGSEWRNNIMLIAGGNYPFKQLAELGNNYLTGYSFILASNNSESVSIEVLYEFDERGRLSKQTKNKVFFESEHNRTLTYQYE
ncbi:hypothetical protein [Winogradskyella sp. 3972H.M.0a.05]|uniref:hypothetical protein n=1 Tax=Winogradskyella sp. 3972H.M.0a.05 TaxID=2950277 RepID=UPI003397AA3F